MTGSSWGATAARPRVVEDMNGIANLLPTREQMVAYPRI